MSWLTWLLFESPAALGAVLGSVLFVLLVRWRRGGRGRPVVVGLGVAVALLVVQALVTTRREHAERILTLIERDLVASRTDVLAAALVPEFQAGALDREAFLGLVQRELAGLRIQWVERWRLEVRDAAGDRFVAAADYLAEVQYEGLAHTPRSGWAFTFVRTPAGWRIGELRCLHVDGSPGPAWEALRR